MSPSAFTDSLNVGRVAVIGAGPCGLAAAKYLTAEKKFSKIEVFEQRAEVGGVWNYTPLNVADNDFSIPRTQPTKLPDTPIWAKDDAASAAAQFVSPVYDFLETNIPHSLMNYSDQKFPDGSALFPKHVVVKKYLDDYAVDIKDLLRLETQVLGVKRIKDGSRVCWEVEVLDLKTRQKRTEEFDAVAVASGHYNDPFIPDIKGLAQFNEMHPGAVSHSKFHRRPDQYQGKKVVVVGNSASGIDLSQQISTVCQQPVIVSEKESPPAKVGADEEKSWAKMVPEMTEFLPEERAVRFSSGEVEKNIDAVLFCTGYFYSFPFLKELDPPVITDGSYARHLYKHILYMEDPTLAFLGIPQRIVPFPVSECQSAWMARLWAERLPLPSQDEMRQWEADLLRKQGESKAVHNLAFPKDVYYINELHDSSLLAIRAEGLENDGVGKIPPHWGTDKAWTREKFPQIKVACRALGEKRHEVKTLEELGFDYVAWQRTREKEQENQEEAKSVSLDEL